ncbi:MAG: methyl-accepting chemotaxis protein [Lachnospiraceae bacterium]|nr:methyl-accepting chemotaxis protein [Lachnospiraceae bacterium]
MKNKRRLSIKVIILVPVFILGVLAVFSNVAAIMNIRNVNTTAVTISERHMVDITLFSDIQKELQEIHKKALSHIIATDLDTLIATVEEVRAEEELLDNYLSEYKDSLAAVDASGYDAIVSNYEAMKYEIANLMAYSGNDDKEAAFALANGLIKQYSDEMLQQVGLMMQSVRENAEQASIDLTEEYKKAVLKNGVIVVLCVAALLITLYSVFILIIRKLGIANREINDIIKGIDQGQGDLTKRISILSNDEIADLEKGINTFMGKLQSIMKMIIENSRKLEEVVSEVQQSVRTSNDSASDLSAVTEELSATMQEVGHSAAIINQSADSVRSEAEVIADKSGNLNSYSKQMKENADKMESDAKANMQETSTKVQEILSVLNQAIEDSKSVEQVNGLTNDILNISSQTNLLALNASIEAARAGEAGKGFAVVADEIRQLADSSRATANRIQEINKVVTNAVHNLAGHSNDLVVYMTDSILPEFENFVSSGEQYKENAAYIENVMNEFAVKTDDLKKAVDEIAASIGTITDAIEEGARGVTGAAESTQVLVEDMENISSRMNENQQIAAALQKETDIFKNF